MSLPTSHAVGAPGEADAALLARVAADDLNALGSLYDRHAPALLRFAVRLVGRQEAEDLVQAVFVRVIDRAAAFDLDAASARPWLFGITVRIAAEKRRSLRRLSAALLDLLAQPRRPASRISDTRPDLWKALDQLSNAKRTVLILAEVEGFTCDEVAVMLSIPVGTVWTRLHHARRELRAICGGRS
jgi:RNA polymerase sigma factor (sigma-70 family)